MNNDQKPSAAAMRIAMILFPDESSDALEKFARAIDAELVAERKAAEEMAQRLRDVKAACMYHGFSDIPRQIDVTLAAYEAARKGKLDGRAHDAYPWRPMQ